MHLLHGIVAFAVLAIPQLAWRVLDGGDTTIVAQRLFWEALAIVVMLGVLNFRPRQQ